MYVSCIHYLAELNFSLIELLRFVLIFVLNFTLKNTFNLYALNTISLQLDTKFYIDT